MTKHPSRKVMNFRHLLGCDTIVTKSVSKLGEDFKTFKYSTETETRGYDERITGQPSNSFQG